MGLECTGDVMTIGRLMWFDHVGKMEDDNWVKRVRNMATEGELARCRLKMMMT